MGKLSLIIADNERDCRESLVDYFQSFERELFYKVCGVKDEFELLEQLNTFQPDILLIDYRMYEKLGDKPFNGVVILMNDGVVPAKYESDFSVNKYSLGREISSLIIAQYTKISNNKITHKKENRVCKIIAVYSPVGGVGKTSLAVGLSKAVSETSGRALYINIEDFPSTDLHFSGGNSAMDFTELLYEAVKSKPNIASVITTLQSTDSSGVRYIKTTEPTNCIYDLNDAHWNALWAQLRESGAYDCVVVDTSCALDLRNRVLFRNCDALVVMAECNDLNSLKLSGFEQNMNIIAKTEMNGDELKSKTFLVTNEIRNRSTPMTEEEKRKCRVLDKTAALHIIFDKYLALYGTVKTNYKFGESAKKLAQILEIGG